MRAWGCPLLCAAFISLLLRHSLAAPRLPPTRNQEIDRGPARGRLHLPLAVSDLSSRREHFFSSATQSVLFLLFFTEEQERDTKMETEKKDAPEKKLANDVANLKVSEGDRPGSVSPSAGAGSDKQTFVGNFKAFSKFGDTQSNGKLITLSQSDKWMKQAKVIDSKKITTTDTGIYFKKQKSMKLTLEQYKAFLDELARCKKIEPAEIKNKMANCGPPGISNAAVGGKAASMVDRLTDVSKYTGSHKQRFDETGKGRGIAGRKDLPDQSGYVQGYQNKDTYKAQ